MRRPAWWCACALWLLVACDEGLVLPAPPGEQPPAIAAVEPGRAFAGDRVTITGRSLTTAGQPGVVRFGASSPAQDVQVWRASSWRGCPTTPPRAR